MQTMGQLPMFFFVRTPRGILVFRDLYADPGDAVEAAYDANQLFRAFVRLVPHRLPNLRPLWAHPPESLAH